MPKYFRDKVIGYYLYYTEHCVMECMHAHASDSRLTEAGSAKFFIKENGDSVITKRGKLNDHEINVIQRYIKKHYKEMYEKWSEDSENSFYRG